MQHDFILLDRSGSMDTLWKDAIGSINAYVKQLAADKVDTGVTLAVFDHNQGKLCFDIVRDRITPTTWREVTPIEVTPRGSTPLNDATAKVVALAEAGNYDKVAIIIMTDGHENASREMTTAAVRALLDRCRAKGWQVIFLGANFDNAQQAEVLGATMDMHVASATANLAGTMRMTATKRSVYGATGQSMGYTAEEKLKAATEAKS